MVDILQQNDATYVERVKKFNFHRIKSTNNTRMVYTLDLFPLTI